MAIRVMLETNVLKFAATKLPRLIPINKPTRNAKGEITGFLLYEDGYVDPNDGITNPEQKREAGLLPQVAALATNGDVELFLDREAMYESWGVKKMDSIGGLFFDAPISEAESPAGYGRVLFYPGIPARELAKQFLIGIHDKRFQALGRLVGGYQGEGQYNLNQLRDAYYVWSAEHNNCEYLLTMDFKLIRMIEEDKKHCVKVKVVRPSKLLELLERLEMKCQMRAADGLAPE